MGQKLTRTLRQRVHLGRVAPPALTVGLTARLVAKAGGQAVGLVLSGPVQGAPGAVAL